MAEQKKVSRLRVRIPDTTIVAIATSLFFFYKPLNGCVTSDIKLIGAGVFELREHFGPGWRMYYIQRGSEIIVMLGGGDKSSQAADITKAQHLAKTLED